MSFDKNFSWIINNNNHTHQWTSKFFINNCHTPHGSEELKYFEDEIKWKLVFLI